MGSEGYEFAHQQLINVRVRGDGEDMLAYDLTGLLIDSETERKSLHFFLQQLELPDNHNP